MNNKTTQLTLFSDAPKHVGGRKKKQEYAEFVGKFAPKLTTDDCYTPPAVYEAVLEWVKRNCDVEGCNVLRPFFPGGNFEAVDYKENDVVIDNPPFSIVTKITRWYMERGIRFFLFAPYLTIFQPGRLCTSIVCSCPVVYENGAEVNTCFVSNMFGDVCAMTAPDLKQAIDEAQKATAAAPLPKYRYPAHVLRATDLGKYASRGIHFCVMKSEAHFITRLDSQGHKGVFGGGYLLSDRLAAERLAAERLAATECVEWKLSDRERAIVSKLNRQNNEQDDLRPGAADQADRLDDHAAAQAATGR